MAQRTSIEDDIGVKSPLSIEALGLCDRLRIPKKIGPSKPLIACGTPRISTGRKSCDKSDIPRLALIASQSLIRVKSCSFAGLISSLLHAFNTHFYPHMHRFYT